MTAALISQGPTIAAIAGATAGTAKLAFHHKKTAAVSQAAIKPVSKKRQPEATEWQILTETRKQ